MFRISGSDNNPTERFIDYLKSENYVDENTMWDIISRPNILVSLQKGINIIIFETNIYDETTQIKCPAGENLETILKKNPYLLLIKKNK